MAPNPPGKPRGVWPLLVLALISGLITMALSAPNSDATREAGAASDRSRLLFNSPIQTPRPIGVITDEALARVLGERRYAYPKPTRIGTLTPTPQRTATVIRTPDDVRAITPPSAIVLSQPQTTQLTYLPHVNVFYGWKGVGNALDEGYAWPNTSHLNNFNLGWWYDWGYNNDYGEYDHVGFVPMVWCLIPTETPPPGPHTPTDEEYLIQQVQQNPGHVWLLFNEPDHPLVPTTPIPDRTNTPTPGSTPTPYLSFLQCARDICNDLYATPGCWWPITPTPDLSTVTPAMAQRAAREYARLYTLIKQADPTARVFCCGQYYARKTNWWQEFLAHVKYLREDGGYPSLALDGVHIHVYPYTGSTTCDNSSPVSVVFHDCLESNLIAYWNDVHQQSPETEEKPLWITEYGFLYGGTLGTATPTPSMDEIRSGLMQPMVGFLSSIHRKGYYRVSWFSVADGAIRTRLMTNTPPPIPTALTILGTEWAGYDPVYPPTSTVTPTL